MCKRGDVARLCQRVRSPTSSAAAATAIAHAFPRQERKHASVFRAPPNQRCALLLLLGLAYWLAPDKFHVNRRERAIESRQEKKREEREEKKKRRESESEIEVVEEEDEEGEEEEVGKKIV